MKIFTKPAVRVLLIVLVGVIVYSNTLHAPFQWDEEEYIQRNPIIEDLGYFMEPSRAEGLEYYGAIRSRYVGYLTFALNYRLHGWAVEGYHAFNISVHILNALLVYLLVSLTLRTPFLSVAGNISHQSKWLEGGGAGSDRGPYIALFAALLFVAHPVQTEAVTYVFQRFASLVSMFYLLSVVAYAGSRLSEGKARRYALYALSLVSTVLAMKTKENAFTLPLAIALYEFLFFTGPAGKRILRLAPLLMTLPIIPLSLAGPLTQEGGIAGGLESATRGYAGSREWYFLTQLKVISTYIRLLLLPVNQNIYYSYPLSRSFFEARVLASLLFHLSLIGSGVWLMRRSKHSSPELRVVAFGVFWFYLTLSVESGFVPIPMLIDEYRVYLPSAGAFAALAVLAFRFWGGLRGGRLRVTAAACAVLAVVGFSAASYARNGLWADRISLWKDTVKKSPGNARAHYNLANYYRLDKQFDRAIEHYITAIGITPDDARMHTNLGLAYEAKGLSGMAVEEHLRAIEIDPGFAIAYSNLGMVYGSTGQFGKAVEYLLAAIKIDPGNAQAYNNLGSVYGSQGMMEEAAENFRTAIRLKPDFAEAYNNLGIAYSSTGQYDKAIESFGAALKLWPDNADVHTNIGTAYSSMGMQEEAQKHFRIAESLGHGKGTP